MHGLKGCSSGKEYCVGDTVITNKKYAMKGSIVGIYPYRKTVAVMFPNGQVSSWKISNLAQVKGCSAYGYGHSKVQFCVDDVVVTNDNPAREGIITGFYPNGMAALTLYSGEILRRKIKQLARVGKVEKLTREFMCFLGFHCPRLESPASINHTERGNQKEKESDTNTIENSRSVLQ